MPTLSLRQGHRRQAATRLSHFCRAALASGLHAITVLMTLRSLLKSRIIYICHAHFSPIYIDLLRRARRFLLTAAIYAEALS